MKIDTTCNLGTIDRAIDNLKQYPSEYSVILLHQLRIIRDKRYKLYLDSCLNFPY